MFSPLLATVRLTRFCIAGLAAAIAAFLPGCAGSSASVGDMDAALRAVRPKDEVIITFHNGGTLSIEPFQHRWTDSVGAYQVRGTRRPRAGSRSTESYDGWIKATEVDSIRRIGSEATPVNVLYLADGSLIYATPLEMVEVPRQQPPGFWCMGVYRHPDDEGILGSDSTFTGTIDPKNVRSVEIVDRETEVALLFLQGLGMIAALPLLYHAGAFFVWAWGR